MCSVFRTEERLEVVDFTSPTHYDEVVFMSQAPSNYINQWIFFNKISNTLWIATATSFLVVILLLKLNNRLFQQKGAITDGFVALKVYANIVKQGKLVSIWYKF